METLDQVLMIGGNARKSGKTTLICRILEAFGSYHRIAAVKAALYDDAGDFAQHHPEAGSTGYLEIQEIDSSVAKDSGKYLASGAAESWFFAALPHAEQRVVDQIVSISQRTDLLIVESNTLRKKITPGLFVMLHHRDRAIKKSAWELQHLVDYTLETGSEEFEAVQNFLGIDKNGWYIKNTKT
jgi:molybdopterin-guanine dinucleotide biosynthesis protein